MKIHPVGNSVLIKRKEKKEVSEGGIILPGKQHKEQMLGIIESLGDSIFPDNFKIGTKVIFPDFTGVLIGKNYVIIKEEDIVATYTD